MRSMFKEVTPDLYCSTVKEAWNAQVMQFTFALIQSDLPKKCSQFVQRNVFGKQDTI